MDKRETGNENMWMKMESGLKGVKESRKEDEVTAEVLSNSEKAYTMVHYLLTSQRKRERTH